MQRELGSDFMTFEQAGNRLRRTKRSVHNYVKKGLLRKTAEGGKQGVVAGDVEQLALELGTDLPALNAETLRHLLVSVQKLSQDMEVVRRAMAIRGDYIRLEPGVAADLHRNACAALSAGKWSLEEINLWASYFDRFDETTLENISTAVHSRSWEPFFQLCSAMGSFVGDSVGYSDSLPLQLLFQKLDEGRKRLRSVVVIWLELKKVEPRQSPSDSYKDNLLKRLVGGQKR